MSQLDCLSLAAECQALEKMIAEAPADAVIDRMSLEARLESVREEMEEAAKASRPSIHGTLSFRGRPVIGSRGIEAVFGTKAVESFEKIVAVRAASFTAPLSMAGRIPNREQCSLVITGTARGSFGFELENRVPTDEFPECQDASSYLEDAISKTLDFFESVRGTDEELAETLADTEERVIKEIADFLTFLAENQAVCELEFGSRSFYFHDTTEVQNCAKRLQKDNLHERDETIHGVFLGVLPHKRQFEFQTAPDNEILAGRISAAVDDPETINSILKQPVGITVHVTQVGSSKPKYRLLSFLLAECKR